jgi:predicted ATPase
LLVETVSTAMGIPSVAGSLALARVLGDRRLLLVLDNCEQVTDDVAELVTCLLERCPALRVLTTSRQTLGVVGELVHVLRPLAESDAETLFLERAAAVVPQWVPDAEDRAAVAQLCRGLDGLPLAIELAAAQCRALSVHQLAGQLEDRFALLAGGRRSNRRHASMTAAIEGSYASLEVTERQVFEALSLFEGSFDFEGVKAVAGGQGALQPLLSLIDKSLVTVLDGSPRRYRILETLRQYAGLHRSEEATRQTKARIVTWVCSVAEQAEAESFGPHSWEWTKRLDQDKDTIRAALSWAAPDPVTQIRIAVGMAWFWYRRGHITEGLRALEPLAILSPTDSGGSTVSSSLLVRGTVGVVLLSYLAGDYARVVGEQDRIKALAAHTDDQAAACFALALVAYFEAAGGSIEMALSDATVALEAARRISSPPRVSLALLAMAMAHLRVGDLEKAQRCAADGLAESDSYGFTWGAVSCIWVWCKARIAAGDVSAETLAGASRIVRDSAANRDLTSWLVGILCSADILFKRGEGSKAAELVGIAHRQGELIGFAPEVMDPVETKQFLVDIMHGIEAEGLTAEFERGRALDIERTFDRVHDLLDVRELLEDRSGSG